MGQKRFREGSVLPFHTSEANKNNCLNQRQLLALTVTIIVFSGLFIPAIQATWSSGNPEVTVSRYSASSDATAGNQDAGHSASSASPSKTMYIQGKWSSGNLKTTFARYAAFPNVTVGSQDAVHPASSANSSKYNWTVIGVASVVVAILLAVVGVGHNECSHRRNRKDRKNEKNEKEVKKEKWRVEKEKWRVEKEKRRVEKEKKKQEEKETESREKKKRLERKEIAAKRRDDWLMQVFDNLSPSANKDNERCDNLDPSAEDNKLCDNLGPSAKKDIELCDNLGLSAKQDSEIPYHTIEYDRFLQDLNLRDDGASTSESKAQM